MPGAMEHFHGKGGCWPSQLPTPCLCERPSLLAYKVREKGRTWNAKVAGTGTKRQDLMKCRKGKPHTSQGSLRPRRHPRGTIKQAQAAGGGPARSDLEGLAKPLSFTNCTACSAQSLEGGAKCAWLMMQRTSPWAVPRCSTSLSKKANLQVLCTKPVPRMRHQMSIFRLQTLWKAVIAARC